MNWAVQLVIAAVIFAAGAAAGVKGHAGLIAQRDLKAHEAAATATAKKLDRIDVAAVGHEADKATLRTKFLTITQEVERVVEKPIYRNICFDDDGLRLIAAATGRSEGASEPAPALSGPGAPK